MKWVVFLDFLFVVGFFCVCVFVLWLWYLTFELIDVFSCFLVAFSTKKLRDLVESGKLAATTHLPAGQWELKGWSMCIREVILDRGKFSFGFFQTLACSSMFFCFFWMIRLFGHLKCKNKWINTFNNSQFQLFSPTNCSKPKKEKMRSLICPWIDLSHLGRWNQTIFGIFAWKSLKHLLYKIVGLSVNQQIVLTWYITAYYIALLILNSL